MLKRGPFAGPRFVVRARARRPGSGQELESNGKLIPAVAGTQSLKWACSRNMVVKLRPEIHNHACHAPRRRADMVVHATSSNGARRSCNSGAPFFIDPDAAAATTRRDHRILAYRAGPAACSRHRAPSKRRSIARAPFGPPTERRILGVVGGGALDLLRGHRRRIAQRLGHLGGVDLAVALLAVGG